MYVFVLGVCTFHAHHPRTNRNAALVRALRFIKQTQKLCILSRVCVPSSCVWRASVTACVRCIYSRVHGSRIIYILCCAWGASMTRRAPRNVWKWTWLLWFWLSVPVVIVSFFSLHATRSTHRTPHIAFFVLLFRWTAFSVCCVFRFVRGDNCEGPLLWWCVVVVVVLFGVVMDSLRLWWNHPKHHRMAHIAWKGQTRTWKIRWSCHYYCISHSILNECKSCVFINIYVSIATWAHRLNVTHTKPFFSIHFLTFPHPTHYQYTKRGINR